MRENLYTISLCQEILSSPRSPKSGDASMRIRCACPCRASTCQGCAVANLGARLEIRHRQPGVLINFPELLRQLDFTTHLTVSEQNWKKGNFPLLGLTSHFPPHTVQHTRPPQHAPSCTPHTKLGSPTYPVPTHTS
jgi:hypothetical protein